MYFVTVLNLEHREAICFGYFETLDEALDAVINNKTDLHESYYTHAVVEKIPPGFYRPAEELYCFEYNLDTGAFEPTSLDSLGALRCYQGWSIALGHDFELVTWPLVTSSAERKTVDNV